MRTGQSPTGGAVIKRTGIPRRGVVAGGTQRSREARGNVIRHDAAESLGTEPGGLVTPIAIRIGAGQRVIIVHVAGDAGRVDVRAGQREPRVTVIKIGGAPARRCMARGAIG